MMHFLIGGAILFWIFHRSTSPSPTIQQSPRPLVAAPGARPASFWEDAGTAGDNTELNLHYPAISGVPGGTGGPHGGGAGGGGGGAGGGFRGFNPN